MYILRNWVFTGIGNNGKLTHTIELIWCEPQIKVVTFLWKKQEVRKENKRKEMDQIFSPDKWS